MSWLVTCQTLTRRIECPFLEGQLIQRYPSPSHTSVRIRGRFECRIQPLAISFHFQDSKSWEKLAAALAPFSCWVIFSRPYVYCHVSSPDSCAVLNE